MKRFNNILFVSHGVTDETEALKQALSLARNNKAELKALIVCPEFPKEMSDYKGKYEASLIQKLEASIQATREAIKVSETDVLVQIEVESGDTPAVRIIRHVLKNAHDLVVKAAEPKDGDKGFKAMDMELLRKCPCPVWLTRPISRHRNEMKIAVAIDPQSMAPEGHDLSLRLLELSRSLADTCSGELNIISCWDYEFEEYLRGNVWIKVSDDELIRTVHAAQSEHRAGLESIVTKSGIQGNLQVHHVRGRADQMIPKYVADREIDILVMGTVARTGIHSFIMGNTAENIVQKLECSLLALKPNGFISPVRAY
jgi:universal stress protein E